MSRGGRWIASLALASGIGASMGGAEIGSEPEPVPVLPPFIVTEKGPEKPDWIHYKDEDREVLSACSVDTTERFISVLRTRRDQLSVLIPDGLLFQPALPTTLILFPRALKASMERTVLKMLGTSDGGRVPTGRIHSISDLRLVDADSIYLFVFLDDTVPTFDDAMLTGRFSVGAPIEDGVLDFVYSTGFLRFLLDGRAPVLPDWFRIGFLSLYRSIDFSADRLEFRPDPWVSQEDADALQSEAHAPRTLLPMAELFAANRPAGKSVDYQRIWSAQAELFVRWAFSGHVLGGRQRLWRFAAASAAQPTTETLFQSFFGMNFSDARDALSDFLPEAVTRQVEGPAWKASSLAPVKTREALPGEIRRIRGEWARRARGALAVPGAEHLYTEEARRLLEGAFAEGDRDPSLLASLALFRSETGAAAEGLRILKDSPEACAARPLASLELARLRLEDALRLPGGPRGALSADQAAGVLDPLSRALAPGSPIEAAYLLAARTIEHLGRVPSVPERHILDRGARLYPRDSEFVIRCASLILQGGDFDSAREVVELGLWECTDAAERTKLLQLEVLARERRSEAAN
jgi:hypothetical protein